MSPRRGTSLCLLTVAALSYSYAQLNKRADRSATGEQPTKVLLASHNVKSPPRSRLLIQRKAGHVRRAVTRIYYAYINRRIERTRARLLASLAQDPDNFDARDRLWQRLHRLQSRRDAA